MLIRLCRKVLSTYTHQEDLSWNADHVTLRSLPEQRHVPCVVLLHLITYPVHRPVALKLTRCLSAIPVGNRPSRPRNSHNRTQGPLRRLPHLLQGMSRHCAPLLYPGMPNSSPPPTRRPNHPTGKRRPNRSQPLADQRLSRLRLRSRLQLNPGKHNRRSQSPLAVLRLNLLMDSHSSNHNNRLPSRPMDSLLSSSRLIVLPLNLLMDSHSSSSRLAVLPLSLPMDSPSSHSHPLR